MKEAATIAGPGASISDKFNELTADVDELLVNIDTEWAIEEAKLDERIADVQTDSLVTLEELLDDKTDISSTMSEIDKLLNEDGTSDPVAKSTASHGTRSVPGWPFFCEISREPRRLNDQINSSFLNHVVTVCWPWVSSRSCG